MRRPEMLLALLMAACTNGPESKDNQDSEPERTNLSPVVTIDSPKNGSSVLTTDVLEFSGFVADDWDAPDALTMKLQTSVDSADPLDLDPPSVNNDGTFYGTFSLPEGRNELLLTATDADGGVGTGVDLRGSSVIVTVTKPGEENQPPSKPVIHLEPLQPITGDLLTAFVDSPSTDPEGAPVTLKYRWLLNGDTTTAYSTEPTLDGSFVHKGDLWSVEVRGNDGQVDGEIATEAITSVTIGNAGPLDVVVGITPATPTVSTSLLCTPTVTDPDDDPSLFSFSYQWTVNGVVVSGATETLAAGTAVYGDTVGCEVVATDPGGLTVNGSSSVVIGNEAPSSPTVGLMPLAPLDTDDLVCSVIVDAVDPDHQAFSYSYAWFDQTGAAITDLSGVPWTVDVLPADLTHRDQVITCEVTATDIAGGSSIPSSATVTIGLAWTGIESAGFADATIDGLESSGLFGKNVALVGDVDGDGLSELLVGASGEAGGSGVVYLFAGSSISGHIDTDSAIASWDGPYSGGSLAGYRSFDAPGDMDNDGASELFFAASDSDANGETSGIAWLLYGGQSWGFDADPRADADWYVVGTTNDHLGTRLATGDINSDGFTDVLVSATQYSCGGGATNCGSVGVFFGTSNKFTGNDQLSSANWFITGDAKNDELGWTLKTVGDVSGDGYDDFVVTSFYANSSTGMMGLFFGTGTAQFSGTVSNLADVKYTGNAAGDRFGYDAVGQVDYNEDGNLDILVAAYLESTVGTEAGAVYVFEGKGNSNKWGDATPADAKQTIYGNAAGDRFGHMMVSPGDLDSDGTDDLLLGALLAEPIGALDQGATYLLLSPDVLTPTGANQIPYQVYGEAAGDYFGDALGTGRGDINGDGKPDFAVGAQRHDAGAEDAGRVYLWWGR